MLGLSASLRVSPVQMRSHFRPPIKPRFHCTAARAREKNLSKGHFGDTCPSEEEALLEPSYVIKDRDAPFLMLPTEIGFQAGLFVGLACPAPGPWRPNRESGNEKKGNVAWAGRTTPCSTRSGRLASLVIIPLR